MSCWGGSSNTPRASGSGSIPAQEAAILELFEEKNVILNTPTGSGKSLVAAALHFKALAQGKRSVYTCPIKALVNEKWLALCREFGPDNVGLSTGDASVNRDAPILCCTAEILANIALREGAQADVQEVIMDEFHYYADRERGVAWQVPLLTLPQARFLLMSATLGDTDVLRGGTDPAQRACRPSPSRPRTGRCRWSLPTPSCRWPRRSKRLVAQGKAPVYVVHFTQLEAAQSAQDFTSINVCTREEKNALGNALEGFKFTSPYGPEIRKWLKHGIGLHHAGLLPKYRVLVEQLAQKGLLKIICGTDTLGVGINVPIRTVLFTRLCKYDGQKTGILSARDFHQIGGRAGRKGFDDRGWVVAQAPEHVVENLKLDEKAARGGKKVGQAQAAGEEFRQLGQEHLPAPDRRPARAADLPLPGLARHAAQRAQPQGRRLPRHAAADRPTATNRPRPRRRTPSAPGSCSARWWSARSSSFPRSACRRRWRAVGRRAPKLRVNVELQDDFSMDQTLSLYLLETLPLVDPQAPDYPLVLLTLVESILEDPDIILRKQLDKLKSQKMAEMKMAGIEYDERMEELEKLEYPKPNREFIYSTFNAFADKHPWVGQENIRPKSIAREMFESFRSFSDYIRDYELQRAEGVLLRHLNSVYKVLAKPSPTPPRTTPSGKWNSTWAR